MKPIAFIVILVLTIPGMLLAQDQWLPLFNGRDLTNFYTFRTGEGKNADAQKAFKVDEGMLHILDISDTSKSQPQGYLGTNEEFRNYRVMLDYKWGTKKFPVPRHENENLPRDSGLLYHVFGPDRTWPQSIEFQIQEHDTGDVWLLENPRPTVTSTVATTQPTTRGVWNFKFGGTPQPIVGQRVIHGAEFDSLTDWNNIELFVSNDEAVHVVNGHVSNIIKQVKDARSGQSLTQGRLAIQAESNEILYRNIKIRPLYMTGNGPAFKLLVFSKTLGFRHDSIPDGIAAIKQLGQQFGFSVDATEDSGAFTEDNLKQYKALLFLDSSGDVFNDAQQDALQKYIRAGGGFIGVHAASTTEYDWPWFGELIGAYFSRHPAGTPTGTVRVVDAEHPLTSSLPKTWTRNDEWYNFRSNPRSNVHVLLDLDESSLQAGGGEMNGDHPICWYHDFEGGRSWYTALGHTKESYSDPLFLMHLLGGIEYAAGRSSLAPTGAIVLDPSHWVMANGDPITWPVHDGVMESKTRVGNIFTKEKFDSCHLHVEFKVPATVDPQTRNAITNEQSRGNSGIYLQSRYEVQILDSFDHPLQDKNDMGAIYTVKDALVNASLPAEVWQRYDIWYTAPAYNGTQKAANARATVYLNGQLVQNDTEIPNMTQSGQPEAPGPGPIMLQDHLNPVQFRNIWIVPKK